METELLALHVEPIQTSQIQVNRHVQLAESEGTRVVLLDGQLLLHYLLGDRENEAFVIGTLARGGHAGVKELARAFGVDVKTVYRYRRKLEKGGLREFLRKKTGPKGAFKLDRVLRRRILTLKGEGLSNRAVARKLGIAPNSVGRVLREEEYQAPEPPRLPGTETLPGQEGGLPETVDGTAGTPSPSGEGAVPAVAPVAAAAASAGSVLNTGLLPVGEEVLAAEKETEEPVEQEAVAEPAGSIAGPVAGASLPGSAEPALAATDELADLAEEETAAEPADAAARPVLEATPPRLLERALAARGMIKEAAPELIPGENLRALGLFLALPCLIEVGILAAVKQVYRALRPGFYGLRSFALMLLFMALFRIKRPEGIKGIPPEILGRHLGLDRSPEMKTVRRKLTEIAQREKSQELVLELARRIREEDEDLVGFLYVDGHVRAYHGKRELPKTWVPTRRMCLPATTDYWVNDAEGGPFFFVTTEGNPGLSKALPDLLREVKKTLGDRRATVIFDRGGWSQKALRKIVSMGFDFITYRRRPYDDLPADDFQTYTVEGEKVDLAEGTAEYGLLGRVRIVAKRDPDGKQVHIVTNLEKEQLGTVEVYLRMTRRWRQENFFRYMRGEYGLDDLISYEMVPADESRLVLNPKWKELDRRVREQRQQVRALEQKLGKGSKEPTEGNRPTLMAFKAAVVETAGETIAAEAELARRIEQRRAVPKRVPLGEALAEPPMRLEFERKIFTDVLKMAAYRAETGLVNAILPDYRRAPDEARKLVREVLHASGDLEVDDMYVTVRLEPLSSPHRTKVLEKLCAILSDKNATYPGTDLRLRYGVRPGADRAPWGRGTGQEP